MSGLMKQPHGRMSTEWVPPVTKGWLGGWWWIGGWAGGWCCGGVGVVKWVVGWGGGVVGVVVGLGNLMKMVG